jgi:hypothetical protein
VSFLIYSLTTMATKQCGTIVTFSGKQIDPLNPDPASINITDIAHALSNQCRFTGHVREFYSVAEHSIRCIDLVPQEDQAWALMHDASEAYLSDIARPVKYQLGLGDIYREAEETLMVVIAERFGLPWPMPESVHEADDIMLRSEQRDLMPNLRRHEGSCSSWRLRS